MPAMPGRFAPALSYLPLLILTSCKAVEDTKKVGKDDDPPIQEDVSYLSAFDAERVADIQYAMTQGIPVFRRVGDEFEFLDHCLYPGSFKFTPLTVFHRGITADSEAALRLNAIRGIVHAGFQHQGQFATYVSMIGKMTAAVGEPGIESLTGSNCRGATHIGYQFDIGAFETREYASTEADAGISAGQLAGIEVGGSQTHTVVDQAGNLANCNSAQGDVPPRLCNAPVRVQFRKLEQLAAINYKFDVDYVSGIRPTDAGFTNAEMNSIADALAGELEQRARPRGISIASGDDIECHIAASPNPDIFVIECKRDDVILVQESGERAVLNNLTPKIAEQLLTDPTIFPKETQSVGRLAILVDVSGSMLVNDVSTFLTTDVEQSKRYRLVQELFRGLLENGVKTKVSLIPFAGTDCSTPLSVDGETTWLLSDATSQSALAALAKTLGTTNSCANATSTDIANALSVAAQLFHDQESEESEESEESKKPKDAVILITDGAHTQGGTSLTPKEAGTQLRDHGAHLNIIRLQLNDLTELRNAMAGASRNGILRRWKSYVQHPQLDPGSVMQDITGENDGGTALLADLAGVVVDSFVMSADDTLADPLVTVFEHLLPQLGGVKPISVWSCDNDFFTVLERPTEPRGIQQTCKINVPRDRNLALKISKPPCMDNLEYGMVEAGSFAKKITPAWRDGSTAAFEPFPIPGPSGSVVSGTLTIVGSLKETPQCDK